MSAPTGEQLNHKLHSDRYFSGQDRVPDMAVEFCEACPRYWRMTFLPLAPAKSRSQKYAGPSKPIRESVTKKLENYSPSPTPCSTIKAIPNP